MIQKNFILSVLILPLFISACHSGGSNNALEGLDSEITQYAKSSCQFNFDSGSVTSDPTPYMTKTHFDKYFMESDLDSVLGASPRNLIDYAETLGVRFYRTDQVKDKACGQMEEVPLAPSDLNSEFTSAGNNVLGLYLNKNTKDLPSTDSAAAIIVRKDSNKWVLTHELMHHLFHDTLLKNGNGNVKEKALKDLEVFESHKSKYTYGKYGSKEEVLFRNYIDSLKTATKGVIGLLKSYSLEEMTIETILAQKFDQGLFTDVLEGQKINGAWYIVSSEEKARELLKLMEDEIWDAEYENGYKGIGLFSELKLEISQLKEKMSSLSEPAKRFYDEKERAHSARFGAVPGAFTEAFHKADCPHSHGVDEIIEKMRRK